MLHSIKNNVSKSGLRVCAYKTKMYTEYVFFTVGNVKFND